MLRPLREVLAQARDAGRGVAAFNVIHLEHAEALAAASEQVSLPVILQISENTVAFHGALAPIAMATRVVAERAATEVVLHLDHALSEPLVDEAIDLGFTSVMFDGSRLDDATNRAVTRGVVGRCHLAGVSVEAELGEIGGKDGMHAPGARTSPQNAAAFAADTGVDALAVAVGSSHAMTRRSAQLDLELIAAIRAQVAVPLVLHGSSGVPDEGIAAAVRAGMTKINIATHLNGVFTLEVRRVLDAPRSPPRSTRGSTWVRRGPPCRPRRRGCWSWSRFAAQPLTDARGQTSVETLERIGPQTGAAVLERRVSWPARSPTNPGAGAALLALGQTPRGDMLAHHGSDEEGCHGR